MKRVNSLVLSLLLSSSVGACGTAEQDIPSDEDVGVIELALQSVPTDVACVRLSAKGPARDKVMELPVKPGPAMAQVLTGFPLGLIKFTAEAFSIACDDLTAKTNPTWISDPIEASVVDGTKTRVEFNMRRNGRVDVTFNFPDEPLCSALGVACKSSKECCSNVCKTDVCQAPAAKPADTAPGA